MKRLILASESPRRRDILLPYFPCLEVIPSEVDERATLAADPACLTMLLALKKAQATSAIYPEATVIGADTAVVSHGKVLGKPRNREQARDMLKELRNHAHEVITGVCLIDEANEKKRVFYDCTIVYTTDYGDDDIERYLATGEPFDKAGAYGIQGAFAPFIEGVEGSYYNVVGLPIHLVYALLKKEFGFDNYEPPCV